MMNKQNFIDFSGETALAGYATGAFLSMLCSIFFPHSIFAWIIVIGPPGLLFAQRIGRYSAKRYLKDHS